MGEMADYEISRLEDSDHLVFNPITHKLELVKGIELMYGKTNYLSLEDLPKEQLLKIISEWDKDDLISAIIMITEL